MIAEIAELERQLLISQHKRDLLSIRPTADPDELMALSAMADDNYLGRLTTTILAG